MKITLIRFLAFGLLASITNSVGALVPDDVVISDQNISDNTSVVACNSIEVGPNLSVDSGGNLSLSAPLVRFSPALSIDGTLSAGDIICSDATTLATELANPAGYDFCISERDYILSSIFSTVTLCSASTCTDGGPGCMIHVTVIEANIAPDFSTFDVSVVLEDTQLDATFSGGINDDCILSATNVAASADGSMGLTGVCDFRFDEIFSINSFISADGDFEITSCPSAPTLNLALSLFMSTILDLFETEVEYLIEDSLLLGLVCPAP